MTDYPGAPCWHCGSTHHDTAGCPSRRDPVTINAGIAFVCSFCGNAAQDVGALVWGPGVGICDSCVDLAQEQCQELGAPWWYRDWVRYLRVMAWRISYHVVDTIDRTGGIYPDHVDAAIRYAAWADALEGLDAEKPPGR